MNIIQIKAVPLDGKKVCCVTVEQINLLKKCGLDYQFQGIDDENFYFIQLKKETYIKRTGQSFPKETIFFLRKKDSETAHAFLAEVLLQLNPKEDLLTAGEFSTVNHQISAWSLRSGSYWRILDLANPDKAKLVGFPLTEFTIVSNASAALATFKAAAPSPSKSTSSASAAPTAAKLAVPAILSLRSRL